MATEKNTGEIIASLRDVVGFEYGEVFLKNRKNFREKSLDSLVDQATQHSDESTRGFLRWLLHSAAHASGIVPASMEAVYRRKGQGKLAKLCTVSFSTPELTYASARSLLRSAQSINSRAFLVNLSPENIEIEAALVLSAALREGFSGALFLQAGPFVVDADAYARDSNDCLDRMVEDIRTCLAAGVFNINVDASALVDRTATTYDDAQRLNCEATVRLLHAIRKIQPSELSAAVGVCTRSHDQAEMTLDGVRSFLDGCTRLLEESGRKPGEISTVRLHHRDGPVDFERLSQISRLMNSTYGIAGMVETASEVTESSLERMGNSGVAEMCASAADPAGILRKLGSLESIDTVSDLVEPTKIHFPVPEAFKKLIHH